MPFASEQEIKEAHDILLKGLPDFDEVRKNIIKNNSSCYVQACPGSGKTTTLLAKLIILANRMPFADGRGICVLTHTNVAIDEIKAKLGSKADILFRYPNFFGTIQAFLHKYIAAAALHYYYGSQITYVDDDISNSVLLKKYGGLKWDSKLKGFIYHSIISKKHIIDITEINSLGGVNALQEANVIKLIGKRKPIYDFQLNGYDLSKLSTDQRRLINLRKKQIISKETIELILSSEIDWVHDCVIINNRPCKTSSPAGIEFITIKNELFAEGILSFKDAYDLSLKYIREKNLDFSSISSKRFRYLFIDEVQDCNKIQVDFINKIFNDNEVIVQRFGDYCQAIYDNQDSDEDDNNNLKDNQILYIRNSNRFGDNIAKPLKTLCMEDNSLLVGSPEVPSVKPIIITYENPVTVLPKYAELLNAITIPEKGDRSILEIANEERRIDPLHRVNVKACGWVGRKGASEKNRFIESYYPAFIKNKSTIKTDGEIFNDFISQKTTNHAKDSAASIIQGILKILDLCDIKNGNRRYTRASFLDFLAARNNELKESFLVNLMSWSLQLSSNKNTNFNNIKASIYTYIVGELLPLFNKEISEDANNFFNASNSGLQNAQNNRCGNIYHGTNIDIEISTVHAVKGETHASTLFLETSYYGKHESERIADQFKGFPYTQNDKHSLNSLRVAYVGMSRPRYLLCVALQKDRFNRMDCDGLRKIWEVVDA